MMQLLTTHIGTAVIPLSYLIRDTIQDWEDIKGISFLQDRRNATTIHPGKLFDIGNKELFHIFSNTFYYATLEDVTLSNKRTQNGTIA